MNETKAKASAVYDAPMFLPLVQMMMTSAKLGLSILAGALMACSPAPMPISQSSRDPSNPFAAEGASPVTATAAGYGALPKGAGASGHEHHHPPSTGANPSAGHESHGPAAAAEAADGGLPGAVYVCPMHPEVTLSGPALCPKCNMKLVPKREASR